MAYTGHILPIFVGGLGLVGTRNQANINPEALIVARNLSYEGQIIRKEGGASKYNSSAITGAPSVIGGWDWWPTTGTQRMVVVLSDGTIKKDSGSGAFGTTLVSALTVSDVVPVFVEGGKEAAANNRKLFIFTGKNQVQVLAADGATTSNLSTPPTDWSGANQPTFGLVHEGRLWGGGNLNDPHRLYYSTATNHEDIAGGGTIAVYPGEGERLVGALSFKGLIIAWKYPQGIYIVDTTDPTIANWKVRPLTRKVGGASPCGMVEVDDDILFLSAHGNYHLLSAVQEFGDTTASNISKVNDIYIFTQENFNLSQLTKARAVYYDAKREAHFAVAGSGSTVNNLRFVMDFNRIARTSQEAEIGLRFRHSDRDTCESLWLRKDVNNIPRLTSGDNAGFVWDMDKATKSKDAAGYSAAGQTPYMDFAWIDPTLGAKRKIGEFLEWVGEPIGDWDLSVDIYWDGELTQTVTFNMGDAGAVLGSFVIGTDALAGDRILTRKRRITGSGRRLSLGFRNSGAGQDISVGQFYLHCKVSDERLGRDSDD